VEGDDPPTVTKLADRGRQAKPRPLVDLEGIQPEDYAVATDGTRLQAALSHRASPCALRRSSRDRRVFLVNGMWLSPEVSRATTPVALER
jgi:hypothetical protein